MIDETRLEFEQWVIDTRAQLRTELFTEVDGCRRFRIDYLLSPEMLIYIIIAKEPRGWYQRILSLEDVRETASQPVYDMMRDYMENRANLEFYEDEEGLEQFRIEIQLALIEYVIPKNPTGELETALDAYLFALDAMGIAHAEGLTQEQITEAVEYEEQRGIRWIALGAMGYVDWAKKNGEVEFLRTLPLAKEIYRLMSAEETTG